MKLEDELGSLRETLKREAKGLQGLADEFLTKGKQAAERAKEELDKLEERMPELESRLKEAESNSERVLKTALSQAKEAAGQLKKEIHDFGAWVKDRDSR